MDIGYTNEQHFNQRYSNLLAIEYPNMQFNIFATKGLIQSEQPAEWLRDHPVDLLYVPSSRIKQFVEEGLLAEIDSLIKRDQLELDQFVPAVVELSKEYGNGKLYGLPSNFYGRAIVYNQDLFDKYDVAYPTDRMSWEELLQLAGKFTRSESESSDLKGLSLSYSSPFALIQQIGTTEGLQFFNDQEQVTFNSSSWAAVWGHVLSAYEAGSLDLNPDLNTYLSPFFTGERAMVVISYEEYKRIEQEKPAFNWSTVTAPVNPAEPERSSEMGIPGMYAITAVADDQETAWELLKFLVSEEAARWDKIQSFYKLTPAVPEDRAELPAEIADISQEITDQIFSRSISLPEGLDTLQQAAEQAWENRTN
ncbi:Bacterial extracellular solute-binding protein [compost metagenome]